jgi:predicted dinucleotide-binding enzyme
VLVRGDNAAARARVVELAAAVAGRRGVDVGGWTSGALRQERVLGTFTAVLIAMNKWSWIRAEALLPHVDPTRAAS